MVSRFPHVWAFLWVLTGNTMGLWDGVVFGCVWEVWWVWVGLSSLYNI